MLNWKELVWLDDDRLGRMDIAAIHLACAVGLPGGPSESEIAECLRRMDDIALRVADYTQHALHRFYSRPQDYDSSEAKFRMICLARVLNQRFGVRYNEAKIPLDVPLGAADTFLHGAILGEGGTCASLPVVSVAVGRRLGYPLKLVATATGSAGHLFVRWDGPGERFNFEANNEAMDCPPDDYYRNHPKGPIPAPLERLGFLLVSQTPTHELSGFMAERGHCLVEAKVWREATDAFIWALSLQPGNVPLRNRLKTTMKDWTSILRQRMMPTFPWTSVLLRRRRFPASVPLDCEEELCGLEGWEHLLNTPELEQHVWDPMRRGLPGRWPTEATIVSDGDTYEIGLKHRPLGGVITT